jgi:Domain of unknown function (DUF4394)
MIMKKRTTIAVGLVTLSILAVMLVVASSNQSVGNAQTSITTGLTLPNRNIFLLTSDQSIYRLAPGATQYARLGRINTNAGDNVIGGDFRPSDGRLYVLTDLGRIYTVNLAAANFGATTLVSTMNPRFTGGFGCLVDFNPVLDALRVAGSNDQNLAVVNQNGGNLNATAAQTAYTYAAGDPFAGRSPELVGGAYDNNRVGAAATTYYVVDHDTDSLATIATRNATGSSNTGTGVLKTIGRFVDGAGNLINMSPTSDFDIYTDPNGRNFLVGQTTRLLFTINLANVNPNLPVGTTQNVVVARGAAGIQLPNGAAQLSGGGFDIMVQ